LTGHSGHGIIVVSPGERLPDAPLYVQYVKKESEYRLHVMRGHVFDAQRKIRDPQREPTNWQIRSHDNGFIFAREGLRVPPDVTAQAIKALAVSGLDFAAVDVLWNAKSEIAYVLEVNTAPGLEGQTVTNYATAFRRYCGL